MSEIQSQEYTAIGILSPTEQPLTNRNSAIEAASEEVRTMVNNIYR